MNKEECLSLLQHLILQLRDHSKELQANPNLLRDWTAKSKYVSNQLHALNACDASWVGDEFSKWHKKEILPSISKIDPSLLQTFNS